MRDHTLHVLIEDDGIVSYRIQCHSDPETRECASWTESSKQWADDADCNCKEDWCSCRDEEHYACGGDLEGYIEEVGPKCRAERTGDCWYAEAMNQIGDEHFDFGRGGFTLSASVELKGSSWDEPTEIHLVEPVVPLSRNPIPIQKRG